MKLHAHLIFVVSIIHLSIAKGNLVDVSLSQTVLPLQEMDYVLSTNSLNSFALNGIPVCAHCDESWFLPELLVREIDSEAPEKCGIVVVADVVAVTPIALVGLDECFRGLSDQEPSVWYRVEVRARHFLRGNLKVKSFSFAAKFDPMSRLIPGAWLYFRGITLRIGLHEAGSGKITVQDVNIANSDPPYDSAGISVLRSKNSLPKSVMQHIQGGDERDAAQLIVLYGDGELVRYGAGDTLISGKMFNVQDFGFSSRIDVVVARGKGASEKWRHRWFSQSKGFSVTEVTEQSIMRTEIAEGQ